MILALCSVGLVLAGWGWWASPSVGSATSGPAGRWVQIDVPCDCPTDN